MTHRQLTADEKADIRNARGFQVPWPRLAEHFGMRAEELQRQMLEQPQWKTPPAELDLFSEEKLEGVL